MASCFVIFGMLFLSFKKNFATGNWFECLNLLIKLVVWTCSTLHHSPHPYFLGIFRLVKWIRIQFSELICNLWWSGNILHLLVWISELIWVFVCSCLFAPLRQISVLVPRPASDYLSLILVIYCLSLLIYALVTDSFEFSL